ncbi:MAG TPA: HEAT repeat domain-containing protein [Ktedonobacteraceae bacterium]|nr:HEAT repeat domain-containing protein [Ktedonobacteraceae bacterium]
MPRGRKGPPQESIDSILLAMSRRDDIEPTTLSHYFDRLDEEWTDGAREKVLHLLRTSDLTAYSAAVLILSELATSFDLEELEDLVADPTISDLAKLTLSPVLKELGSEMADDGIIDYLNDPEAAMLQMQIRLLELVGRSELGVESVLEDVLSMSMERRLGFIDWLGMSQDPRATKLLIPLLENQSTKVVLATIESLQQLGPTAAHQSIPALNYLLANHSNRQVKQQARAALGRLTMYSSPGTEDAAMTELLQIQQQPLHEARVSFVDGAGTQMIIMSWKRDDGLLKGVNVLFQDDWGIKDCYGTDEMEIAHWEELVGSMEEQGFDSFQVPLDYCRAVINEARAVNKRTRHRVPVAYAVWRPFIEGSDAAKKLATPIETILEPRPFNPEVATLAQRGDDLYKLSEFTSWFYDPFDAIKPFIAPYTSILGGTATGTRGRKRKGPQKSDARSTNLEAVVSEALEKVIDDQWRILYESRLRRQGALFQLVNRDDEAQLMSAVAAMLHPDSGVPPQNQPFLRAMMHRSLENGLLRLMTEAFEQGPFRTRPLDLFPKDDDPVF